MTGPLRGVLDLLLVTVLTALAVFAILVGLGGPLRILLVVPLVTILPGYALFALLYPSAGEPPTRSFDESEHQLKTPLPGKRGLDTPERLVLSTTASLVLVAAAVAISNFTPGGISTWPVVAVLAGITFGAAVSALGRRLSLPRDRRSTLVPSAVLARVSSAFGHRRARTYRSGPSRTATLALIASLLLFSATVAYAAVAPPQGQRFTEFYVDSENVTGDTQSMYPAQYTPNEGGSVPVVVANHERTETDYTVVALLQRVDRNGSTTRVIEEEQLVTRSASIPAGENRTISLSVSPTMEGSDLRMALLLYRNDPPSSPTIETAYRHLTLPVDVGTAADRQSSLQATGAPVGPTAGGA